MKKLLLILLLLLFLPVNPVWSAESGGKVMVGALLQKEAKGTLALSAGTELIILTKPDVSMRVVNYTGIFRADTPDDLQGGTNLTMMQKYLKVSQKVTAVIAFGSGVLYDVKDQEDKVSAAVAVELGASIYKWIGLGVFGIYAPQPGYDQSFVGLTLDLASPL
jgi:hypothetical protein